MKLHKHFIAEARHHMHDILHASDVDSYRAHKKDHIVKAEKVEQWGHWIRVVIASVILLSMASVILETEPELELSYREFFRVFEIFTVAIFSIEYILRIWCIVEDDAFKGPILGRLKYAVTPLALVDLVAIAPFYLPALIPMDLRFVRILRLIRLVRVMKLAHFSDPLSHIAKVITKKKSELAASLFILAILLLFASTIMYYVEHDSQPEKFRSIPTAFWWGIETLTTVGYGDVAPITPLGKVCAAIIAILGIGLFGLPTAIIATGFLEEVHNKRDEVQLKRDRLICDECKRNITQSLIANPQEEATSSVV